MKVLLIWKALVSEAYHSKLKELAKFKDIELTLIVPKKWQNIYLEKKSCEDCRIIPTRIVMSGYNHFHWYPGLEKYIRQIQPDIFHIEEEHYSLVTFQAIRLARKYNIKCLFVTWQNIYKEYPFPFSWMEKYNLKNADYAIAGNKNISNTLKRKGFDKERISLIPLGTDTLLFSKNDPTELRSRLHLESFTIGYLGRLIEDKGVLDLLEALSQIKSNFNLLMIGSGKLKNKIDSIGKRLGISEQIRLIDSVPSSQVPDYLNCMDCIVLPSRTTKKWKEQFGRVLTEAMSCEVPVIGSDSGEIPNVLGDCGLIFKEGDIDDLYSKIKLLINSKKLRTELAKKGRQRVLDNFTQEIVARETYKIYQKMMH
ncbi:MAG: glycosyltransferase [Candidatus Scalindua sp.]|jgi:glycosyltransferase involved in cell wall biosynthesis|nr:glycosyltransferase [Candidatus Scalindua sp.]